MSETIDNKPATIRKTRESSFDRIYRYYYKPKSNQVLDPEDDSIRERIEKAWSLLRQHRTMGEAAKVLQKRFEIGKSVAYDDVNNAMLLFGDPRNDQKDAKRAIAESMALKGARKAWKDKDMMAYNKFIALYTKINNLEGDDDTRLKDLLKKQRPVSVVFITDTQSLQQQALEMMKDVAIDTEFEQVNEGDKKEG